ncbi:MULTISPECIES: ribosome maturation factor RimP [Psychrobacter]|jgi:ribosome maturation factor RimP|uniref:Ribosome maturation factor RimP n=1 Tax=Psychrobacter glaciei TaxID=619771 RepID=A0ABQ3GQ24_9GAMM|nr:MULTISPECIES: ribosome maturation factor RimP [Psychrobacter]MBF4489960.1 ribosome maturation factor RimP [Psychrobacter sp. N25K4-3-2]MBP3946249.1 ribosome maturation factor RimP [Psychrobacter sp. K31L]GHD31504.1 ribosome maturation factor RimP [Psychrobacter glaciei]
MKLSTKVAELTTIIAPAVAACDVALWGVEFTPQGNRSLLRIYIEALPEEKAQDKQVSIENCAAVNHQVSGILEVHDPIAGEFILEVSSPGFDRAFFSDDQMYDYVGQTVSLRLIQAIGEGDKKRRKATGTLDSIDATSLKLTSTDGEQFEIALSNIDKANLIYEDV